MTHQQAIEIVKSLESHRRNELTVLRDEVCSLCEENAEFVKIIADYDKRLAQVEAERDELKFRLDFCNAIAKRISMNNLMRHRQRVAIGGWHP